MSIYARTITSGRLEINKRSTGMSIKEAASFTNANPQVNALWLASDSLECTH